MNDKFPLKHLALYSKGWYKRFNPKGKNKTIWDDLKIILELDGYTPFDNVDIVSIILNKCKVLDKQAFDLTQFVFGITPQECWKSGYYTKDHNWGGIKHIDSYPEYDYLTAVVYYCLSEISILERDKIEELPYPDYINGLPRKNGITDKKLNQAFNNKN